LEKDEAIIARFRGENSEIRGREADDKAARSGSFGTLRVAKAHKKLERSAETN